MAASRIAIKTFTEKNEWKKCHIVISVQRRFLLRVPFSVFPMWRSCSTETCFTQTTFPSFSCYFYHFRHLQRPSHCWLIQTNDCVVFFLPKLAKTAKTVNSQAHSSCTIAQTIILPFSLFSFVVFSWRSQQPSGSKSLDCCFTRDEGFVAERQTNTNRTSVKAIFFVCENREHHF